MMMGSPAFAFEALFAFASPAPCARTAAPTTNATANARTFLVFIEPSFFQKLCRAYHRAGLSLRSTTVLRRRRWQTVFELIWRRRDFSIGWRTLTACPGPTLSGTPFCRRRKARSSRRAAPPDGGWKEQEASFVEKEEKRRSRMKKTVL